MEAIKSALGVSGPALEPPKRMLQQDPEQQFELIAKVGRGSFGDVYKARDKLAGDVIALKIIDFEQAEDEIEDIQREISMLSQCNSSHITRYYGSYLKGSRLFIAMEYMGGGALDKLMRPRPFEEGYVAILLREMLKALDYMHDQGKIHRDISKTCQCWCWCWCSDGAVM